MAIGKKGDSGHYVTLTSKGKDGQEWRHVVFIKDGEHRVSEGHHRLTPPGKPAKKVKPSHPLPEHWHNAAKEAGVNPDYLHHLAHDFLAHDREFKADYPQIIRDAKRIAQSHGYGDLSSLTMRRETGGKNRNRLDHHHVRGLDVMAHDIAARYPGVLGDNPSERLFELLTNGAPALMGKDEAYQQALDHLAEHVGDKRRRRKPSYADDIPFSACYAANPLGADDVAAQVAVGLQLAQMAGYGRRLTH